MKVIKRAAFTIYLAANMALCAILFAPWALPRETISGLLGRWKSSGTGMYRRVGAVLSVIPDAIYFWEPNHCVEVFKLEQKARAILYP